MLSLAELDRIRKDCRKMVTTRSLMSAAAAVVPIPGADIVADVSLLATLSRVLPGARCERGEAMAPTASPIGKKL